MTEIRRVLLTGSEGYIGSVLGPALVAEGFEVTGLDVGFFADCVFGIPETRLFPVLKRDVRDVVPADLTGFDAVIHLAALSNDPLGDLKRDWTLDINYRASTRIARAAKEAGVRRFLFSSSCSMYGAAGKDDLMNEQAPLRPVTPYAESKVRTEDEVSKLADSSFSPVFLRNATVYGVSPRLRTDLVLNNLVGWAYLTGKIKLMSDGTAWRPLVHVEDVTRAFIGILRAPREAIHNQAFNVGANSDNYQIRDLAHTVEEVVAGAQVEFQLGASADLRSYRVDFSKLANLLQTHAPKWNVRLGASHLSNAYRSAGLTLEQFQATYVRLNYLRKLIAAGALDTDLRWKGNTP